MDINHLKLTREYAKKHGIKIRTIREKNKPIAVEIGEEIYHTAIGALIKIKEESEKKSRKGLASKHGF